MEEREKLEKDILKYIEKERSLSQICEEFDLMKIDLLSIIHEMRKKGYKILLKKFDDDIYAVNHGDLLDETPQKFEFKTGESNEFKFIAISDTILGSKYQQLSILNDIYKKGHEMGYNNVILCGNISTGYSKQNVYDGENFVAYTYDQIDYILKNFPQVSGMKTYFVTGKKIVLT